MSFDIENKDFKMQKKHLWELLYIPIFFTLFFVIKSKLKQRVVTIEEFKKIEIVLFFSLLGLFHILASNILSFLYNLRTFIFPFFKRPLLEINARNIKIIGAILIIISFMGWLIVLF